MSSVKVILLVDIKGIGKRMEIKAVSSGYAKNYLIPKKLATFADPKALAMKQGLEMQEKEAKRKRKELRENLQKEKFVFQIKAGEKGEVFGSVSAHDIKNVLEKRGYGDTTVLLDRPIRELGEHEIEIHLGKGVVASAKILIEKS